MDILPQNMAWYDVPGMQTIVVDNGSTDGSYEYCQELLKDGKILHLSQIKTEHFEWGTLLRHLHETAKKYNPKWLMLTAPDEFFETADGTDLVTQFEKDIDNGYNVLAFENMEFWMTREDNIAISNPIQRIRFYSRFKVGMERVYPNLEGLDLLRTRVHRFRV